MPEETEVPSFESLAATIDTAAAQGQPADLAAKEVPTTETPKVETPKAETPKVEASKEAPPAKPETPPAKEETPLTKLVGKKSKEAPAKPETPTTAEKPIDWKTAPQEFRDRHEKLLTDLKTTSAKTQEFQSKVAEYEKRIAEIEAKSGDTSKADLKLVEEYTAKIANYEATIREMDYSKSQEFKEKFIDKHSAAYADAVRLVSQLKVVTGQDNDGNPTYAQATQADLNKIMALPWADRLDAAERMFGQNRAQYVIQKLDQLDAIKSEAAQAIEAARTNGELRTKEQRLAEQKQSAEYQKHLETFQKELQTEWPDYFTEPKDDPEGAQALKAGFELVDAAINKSASMTLQDRAAHNAVLRARAGAFPLMEHRITKLTSQVESLTKELEGLRGSDPGNGGAKPVPSTPKDDDLDFKAIQEIWNRPE